MSDECCYKQAYGNIEVFVARKAKSYIYFVLYRIALMIIQCIGPFINSSFRTEMG